MIWSAQTYRLQPFGRGCKEQWTDCARNGVKEMNSGLLKQKAKRAYEWGRLVSASKWLLVVAPLVCLGLYASHSQPLALLCGFSLALLVLGSKWRGQEFGSGVLP